MMPETLRSMIVDLANPDEQQRQQAHQALLQEDEVIIPALIDEFYAGVGMQTGTALLELIGQIGGYQAIGLFLELLTDSPQVVWREIAERWLQHDGIL
jgi:hypothetical protein